MGAIALAANLQSSIPQRCKGSRKQKGQRLRRRSHCVRDAELRRATVSAHVRMAVSHGKAMGFCLMGGGRDARGIGLSATSDLARSIQTRKDCKRTSSMRRWWWPHHAQARSICRTGPVRWCAFSISLASDAQEALVFAMHYAYPARVRLSGTYICRARVLALPSWKSLGETDSTPLLWLSAMR